MSSVSLGSEGGIRTRDQLVNSQLRYHCATSEYFILLKLINIISKRNNMSISPIINPKNKNKIKLSNLIKNQINLKLKIT